eukprot:jgi/Astpho2/1393/Aster-06247
MPWPAPSQATGEQAPGRLALQQQVRPGNIAAPALETGLIQAAAAAGGVVPQAQVRVTKNVGGDVSLISWEDPVLPAKEVYSAVLTADGKHALVKTPSDVVGQSKTEVLLVSETASPSLADIILGPLKQREAQGSPQQAVGLQAGATDSPEFSWVPMSQRMPRQPWASVLDPSWDAGTAQGPAVIAGGQQA